MQANPERLAAVGPRSDTHGFPLWFRDGNGVRLELGLNRSDPNLPAIGEPPATPPPAPFPPDFPDEAFYFLAEAELTTGGTAEPGRARLVLALEAAFGGTGEVAPGQQMVFGRIRVRIDDAIPGADYTVTHPYGVTDPLRADDRGRVFVTQDLGGIPGLFEAALDGQVAPFLGWTTGAVGEADAPPGYLGDGVTPHTITGSPFGTNIFRIQGPDVAVVDGGPPPADPDVLETNLFTVQGRFATVAGVEVTRAVYSRDTAGEVLVDVLATTEPGQAIEVDAGASTGMRADGERYVARVATGTVVPATIEVRNVTDTPPTVRTVDLLDAVVVDRADYDLDTRTLTVEARSSDAQDPELTLSGAGLADTVLAGGTVDVAGLDAPPLTVTVTSAARGTGTRTVALTGAALDPVAPTAVAGADRTVQQGQTVVLDGGGSGAATSFAWAQTSGTPVTLSTPDAARASFTAPTTAGDLVFTLTVDGPGGSDTATVTLTVAALTAPVARAGADPVAELGTTVVLDGSASTGAATFAWTQIAGPAIGPLTGDDTDRPSFVMPDDVPVTLRLTVTGPGGPPATDDVTVGARVDQLQVVAAQFRTGRLAWRVRGTATGSPPDEVTVRFGGATVGTALVDPEGGWDVRHTVLSSEPHLRPGLGATVTVTSSRGAERTEPVLVRN